MKWSREKSLQSVTLVIRVPIDRDLTVDEKDNGKKVFVKQSDIPKVGNTLSFFQFYIVERV